jgi:hypothetical protein
LDLVEIGAVFFALSHEARRHIVMLLGNSGGELPSGYRANASTAELGRPQVSKNQTQKGKQK